MPEQAVPPTELQRERQRRALGDLRDASGLDLTPLAARVGVSASQMSRYIQGDTILPQQMYDVVAAAFGISRVELIIDLGLLDDDDEDVREAVETLYRVTVRKRRDRPNGDERAHVAGQSTGA